MTLMHYLSQNTTSISRCYNVSTGVQKLKMNDEVHAENDSTNIYLAFTFILITSSSFEARKLYRLFFTF